MLYGRHVANRVQFGYVRLEVSCSKVLDFQGTTKREGRLDMSIERMDAQRSDRAEKLMDQHESLFGAYRSSVGQRPLRNGDFKKFSLIEVGDVSFGVRTGV